MDIKLLEDFIALAQTKSFTEASQKRCVTQSAFSRRIQSLEKWAGIALVDRKGLSINLTPAGVDFLESAKNILNSVTQTQNIMQSHKNNFEKRISIASQNTIIRTFLINWMELIEENTDKIYWNLKSEKIDECLNLFKKNQVDFLFCFKKDDVIERIDTNKYDYITVGQETLLPVINTEIYNTHKYDLSHKNDSIPYLAYSPKTLFGKSIQDAINNHSIKAHLSTQCENEYSHILYHMVLRGRGMAWLPLSRIKDNVENKVLTVIGDDTWHLNFDIILCSHKNYTQTLQKKILHITKDNPLY